jgi:RNA polymerase sigma factor (TIGR02999 family)
LQSARPARGRRLAIPDTLLMDDTVPRPGEVTLLLGALQAGDRAALDRVLPRVYDELRALARSQLRRQPGATLEATALVHEAYVKLGRSGALNAVSRSHFLAIAASAMRQVLIDRARAARSQKRGGGAAAVTLSDQAPAAAVRADELLALDEALATLEPRQRLVVECRFFAGMEEREIAEALGVSERTVRREWVRARAWLYARLYPEPPA